MIFQLVQAKAYYTVEDHSGSNRKAHGSQWVRISNGFCRRVHEFRIQILALHLWKQIFQAGKGSIIWKIYLTTTWSTTISYLSDKNSSILECCWLTWIFWNPSSMTETASSSRKGKNLVPTKMQFLIWMNIKSYQNTMKRCKPIHWKY